MSVQAQPVRQFQTPEQIILDALRLEVIALLGECTEEQQVKFRSIYSVAIERMSERQLRNALSLCQRTVKQNEKTRQGAA